MRSCSTDRDFFLLSRSLYCKVTSWVFSDLLVILPFASTVDTNPSSLSMGTRTVRDAYRGTSSFW